MKSPNIPSSGTAQRYVRLASLLGATALVTGCATVTHPNPDDPWESYNRSMYTFNDTVDRALLKPIAIGYDQLMPDPAQTCIHNVFGNLGDVWSAINSFLQGRGHRSEEHTSELQSLMRISYAVFCLKKKKQKIKTTYNTMTEITT